MKVLYFDDDPIDLTIMEDIFEYLPDYQLVIIQGSATWHAEMVQHTPVAVILDLQMPELGGDRVAAEIRKLPAFQDIPLVAYSAVANFTDEFMNNLRQSGFNDFVQKDGIKIRDKAEQFKRILNNKADG